MQPIESLTLQKREQSLVFTSSRSLFGSNQTRRTNMLLDKVHLHSERGDRGESIEAPHLKRDAAVRARVRVGVRRRPRVRVRVRVRSGLDLG